MKFIYAFIALIALSSNCSAQTLSVRCKFSDGQVTDFDKGNPNTIRASDLSELVFDQIDLTKNTARLIGNVGAETLRAFKGFDSIHLIEATASGNMNITTIFMPLKSKNQSIFAVVHSRHVNTATGPFPSQYLGFCSKLL